ncbi:MAG: DUF4058 family protein [Cyanobacteria bacterium J06638_22]
MVVEEAIYQTEGQDSVLVGVPEVRVQQAKRVIAEPTQGSGNGLTVGQPIVIDLPMPDVVRQGYLEIQDVATGEVITVIEVLSPTNKRPGEGRRTYEAKRQTILASATNLIEIDLLRQWPPIVCLPEEMRTHYRILVSARANCPQASLYAFNMQEPIPAFPLPLQEGESEPIVHLQGLIGEIYDQSGYDLVIDYREDPIPPLAQEDAVWLAEWMQQRGL